MRISLSSADMRELREAIRSLPYTISTAHPFELEDHVHDIDHIRRVGNRESRKVVTAASQVNTWRTAYSEVEDPAASGWTMCISADATNAALTDLLAAKMVSRHLAEGRAICWIEVREAIKLHAHTILEYIKESSDDNHRVPSLVVIAGLRQESSAVHWTRAYEILRSTSPTTSRIIVASGANPLAVMDRLALPVQVAINLSTATVNSVIMS